jgi:hypothetical protein
MDKHRFAREADTGIIEIKRVLECLLKNNYEFEGTEDDIIRGRYSYPDEAIANFTKPLEFSDTDGNWITDGSIKVSIQFEKKADYTHFEKNKDEDNVYVGNTNEFIEGLIEETQKKLRKKRRTRKRRSSTISKRAASI